MGARGSIANVPRPGMGGLVACTAPVTGSSVEDVSARRRHQGRAARGVGERGRGRAAGSHRSLDPAGRGIGEPDRPVTQPLGQQVALRRWVKGDLGATTALYADVGEAVADRRCVDRRSQGEHRARRPVRHLGPHRGRPQQDRPLGIDGLLVDGLGGERLRPGVGLGGDRGTAGDEGEDEEPHGHDGDGEASADENALPAAGRLPGGEQVLLLERRRAGNLVDTGRQPLLSVRQLGTAQQEAAVAPVLIPFQRPDGHASVLLLPREVRVDGGDDPIKLGAGVAVHGDPVAIADLFGELVIGHMAQRQRDDVLVELAGVSDLLVTERRAHRIGGDDEQEGVRALDRPAQCGGEHLGVAEPLHVHPHVLAAALQPFGQTRDEPGIAPRVRDKHVWHPHPRRPI